MAASLVCDLQNSMLGSWSGLECSRTDDIIWEAADLDNSPKKGRRTSVHAGKSDYGYSILSP